ncbi:MAG: ABC transporter substrate-binding protein, partial [Actinomycetota bacterium]|nr:ABC transporter substrate-binding protein [Actinomycetota bacterium]
MRGAVLAISLGLLLSSCGGDSATGGRSTHLTIVVNAPFSRSPYIGKTIYQGAALAVDKINAAGGVKIGPDTYTFGIKKVDNGLSPEKALQNVRAAVAEDAVAVIDEGTGVLSTWRVANAAHIPVCVVYQGGEGIIDPEQRPNLFRIAPTDHGVAFRFAEYLIPKGLKVAFIHDDSDYGEQGAVAFDDAWGSNPKSVAAELSVPADATDLSAQVLQARRSGATALLVWAHSPTVAAVVRAARSGGWDVPVYTAPSGEDPLVREQLSDHADWIGGLTFAAGRMTSEKGPANFLSFQKAYEEKFGPDEVGVKTSSGQQVIAPPDYAMYPYDFVNVLVAAMKAANATSGSSVISALNQVD